MRTTVTLDPDVVRQLEALRREEGLSFKDAVNQTLRQGFAAAAQPAGRRYVMPARDLGLCEGIDIDRIRDVLSAEDDARLAG